MPQGTFHPIRARSHLLQLLGDELIGDDRLAIFELVKNGYDADANTVEITVNLAGPVTARSIIVQDSGVGMSLNDITTKWLELATDSKRRDRASRTPVFHRRALGEKGVGRIAAFKLGRHVSLTTRAKGQPEYQVEIDWNKLLNQGPYLESLSVRVVENEIPMVFSGAACGTRIAIRDLRREDWSRGDIRKLYRLVTSLASPFEVPDQFEVKFRAPGREADIKDMVAPNNFLDLAVWKFEFEINGRSFDWKYEFSPPHWKKLKPRTIERRNDRLLLAPLVDVEKSKRATDTTEDDPLFLNEGDLSGIGPIKGQIYAYHRRSEVLSATGSLAQVKSWLDDQTGVRVYRDGVRVFTYGERSDDWLGLNVRRINTPAGKLGTNSVVAAVHLDLESSNALREKTNREGFDQNPAFERLRRVVLSVFEHFEREHADDRRALDDALKGASGEQPIRFAEAIQHLRAGLKGQKLEKTFEKEIDAIEREFVQLRDVMTNSGMAGLNLAVVFHEVEREVEALAGALDRGLDEGKLREQVDHLHQLLQGFAPLLRKSTTRSIFVSSIVRAALMTREPRFKHHGVVISAPVLVKEHPDFKVRGATNLFSGAIGNLLDNALFWARYRRQKEETSTPAAVMVATDWDEKSKSGFVAVVDNGPGFDLSGEQAVKAFMTTRPGGMGLGLYFASHVMEQCGGELTIHSASELREEIEIPPAFDGAAVVLRFKEAK